jgi:hypothetical protein
MLTFEVASFDIRYNCILRRPFFLKFVAVIHTAYATTKMPSSKSIITIKDDQRGALACKNVSLSHLGCFGDKAAQEHAAKAAKKRVIVLLANHRLPSHQSATFDNLCKYKMMLNPKKCVFGVSLGKLLGYMVSARGIDANPKKVEAIEQLQPPQTQREIQKL